MERKISVELLEKVVTYLAARPYAEVANIINEIMKEAGADGDVEPESIKKVSDKKEVKRESK